MKKVLTSRASIAVVALVVVALAVFVAVGVDRNPAGATQAWSGSCFTCHATTGILGSGTGVHMVPAHQGKPCSACHPTSTGPGTVAPNSCSSQCHTAFTTAAAPTGGDNLAAWHVANGNASNCSGCHPTAPAPTTTLPPSTTTTTAPSGETTTTTSSPTTSTTLVADTTPPVVDITAPAAAAVVSGTVTVSVNATDNVGVTKVELRINGVLKATDTTAPYSFQWNTSTNANGTVTIAARAYDAAGNTGDDAITVTASNATPTGDTTPPTVSITSPTNGQTVSGTVTISVTAADNVGVAKVGLFIDGTLISLDTSSPYSFSWSSSSHANGAATIKVTAYDAAGNTASSSISVTVSNADSDTPTG